MSTNSGPGTASSAQTTDEPSSGTDSDDEGTDSMDDTDSDPSTTGDGPGRNTPSHCGGGEPLEWQPNAQRVSGLDFSVSFGADEWYNVSSYRVGGEEVLFDGGGVAPNYFQRERLAGIGVFSYGSGTAYSYDGDGVANASDIQVSAGEAVVFVTVRWGEESCSGSCDRMGGQTFYTITPDGRIVRYDDLETHRTGPGEWLTSYLALDASLFDLSSWGGTYDVDPEPLLSLDDLMGSYGGQRLRHTNEGGDPRGEQWLCLSNEGGGRSVGYAAFPHPFIQDSSTLAGYSRVSENGENDPGSAYHAVALQFDWIFNGTVGQQNYGGSFMTYADADDSNGNCGCVEAQSDAYMHPPTISAISGGIVADVEFMSEEGSITGDVDGDGFYERGGYYGIEDSSAGTPAVVQWSSAMQSVLLFVEADAEIDRVFVGDEEIGSDVWFTQYDGGVAWLYIGAEIPADTDVTIQL